MMELDGIRKVFLVYAGETALKICRLIIYLFSFLIMWLCSDSHKDLLLCNLVTAALKEPLWTGRWRRLLSGMDYY